MPGSDYFDPRVEEAIERAAALLAAHEGEWRSVVEAYWLVRRHEKEIGFPLNYSMVVEAVERARKMLARERELAAAEV